MTTTTTRRRGTAVALLTLLSTSLAGLAPAAACACGGAVPLDGTSVEVSGETSLVSLRDGRETITMQLAMLADADETALVVPTPAPATVTSGSAEVFSELSRLTAPQEVVDRRWFPEDGSGGDGVGTPAPGADTSGPTVLDQVQLGPLEATTLAGGDLDGLSTWLQDNGYALDDRMTSALRPYVDEGWAFVAMRLTSDEVLAGDLDPVTMTFAADELVYPMRMSAQAQDTQRVTVYVVADHRVERTDDDAGLERVDFAGWVDGSEVVDPDLAAAVGDRAFLTAFSSTLTDPGAITSDFEFSATDDVEYRRTVTVTQDVRVLGLMAGPVLVVAGAGVAVLLVGLVVVAVALTRSRPSAGPRPR